MALNFHGLNQPINYRWLQHNLPIARLLAALIIPLGSVACASYPLLFVLLKASEEGRWGQV